MDQAKPATIDAAIRAEFEAMGVAVPPQEEDESDVVEIWEENAASFLAFADCHAQWRLAVGFGVVARLGLDWPAVDVLLRRRGLGDEHFEDLLVMEDEALKAFAEAER